MKRTVKILVPAVFWVLIWAVLAQIVGQTFLLPDPATVAVRLWELGGTAFFWRSAGATVLRIFGGMSMGVLLGGLIAWLTFFLPWADLLLTPMVKIIRATPVASFILLVFLWTSRNAVPTIISALMVLPVVWGGVMLGLGETDGKLLELCRAYRFGRMKTVRLLYLPSVRPHFISAVQTALGLAWKAGVAAEVLCQPRFAIGTQVFQSKNYLETADLFAWTAVVIALSFLVEYGVKRLIGKGAAR